MVNVTQDSLMSETTRAFWSLHTHSKFSAKDALPTVKQIVDRAAELGYPCLGLTDHGNMAGTVQLYKECRKRGIKPLPGFEAYYAHDETYGTRPSTVHMCVLAYTQEGYRNLARLTTETYKKFKYKPILSSTTLAEFYERGWLKGLIATTGCWFGVLPTAVRESQDDSVALNILVAFSTWFDRVFVELQMHKIERGEEDYDEIEMAEMLMSLADSVGVSCVLTQDSHYVHKHDRDSHDTLKELLSWSDEPDSAKFPGDGYHMVDTTWMRDRWPAKFFDAGMAGLAEISDMADVVIPELDNYSLKVPDVSSDPDTQLRKLMRDSSWYQREAYAKRIEEELEVIEASGFSQYLWFVQKVCRHMRSEDIKFAVRGSVSGSLICFLLQITDIDPIEWDLRFDRFLSKDRTKPPDIDIDVQHDRREEVLEWLEKNYPLHHIGTWLSLGLNDEEGGSLVVKYKSTARKKGLDTTQKIPPADFQRLKELAEFKPLSGYGVHAAGLLITPDQKTMDSVPLQRTNSNRPFATAYDKDDVEALGLVKLDLLGLKTLTGVDRACRWAGIQPWEWQDYDDPKVFRLMARSTAGIFQLEGAASTRGMSTMKPTSIHDVIAAMALFRPATLSSGATDSYIQIKNGRQKMVDRHSIIRKHTASTYGVLLYQEQIMGVLRDMGMTADDLMDTLKAVKASNADVGGAADHMKKISDVVEGLCKKNGMRSSDIEWVKKSLDAYAGYSFNKSHATAYGMLSYATAWLRLYYPAEFWCAMLNAYVGADQEEKYIASAQADGVKFARPNVNVLWDPRDAYALLENDSTIVRGLATIHGVGFGAAKAIMQSAPYNSFEDFVDKVNGRAVTGLKDLRTTRDPSVCPGVIGALYKAGALDELSFEQGVASV